MKMKLIITILLLLFVASSLVVMLVRNFSGEESTEHAAVRPTELAAEGGTKVIAYYFHGNVRCKTCLTIEMYALEAIESGFPEALRGNRLEFVSVNLDEPENEHFIEDFQLAAKTVVLERVVNGERGDYVNLTRVWELVGNKEAYIEYVQDATEKMLNGET